MLMLMCACDFKVTFLLMERFKVKFQSSGKIKKNDVEIERAANTQSGADATVGNRVKQVVGSHHRPDDAASRAAL